MYVRYKSVIPNAASYIYEQKMYDNGTAFVARCGDATISVVDEKNASLEYKNCLDENPYYFVDFENGIFVKDKTFILDHEMVAM